MNFQKTIFFVWYYIGFSIINEAFEIPTVVDIFDQVGLLLNYFFVVKRVVQVVVEYSFDI